MTDVLYAIAGGRSKRLRDMGDGTYADVIATTDVTGSTGSIVGFGKLAVTNSSALVSTLTIGPNSEAWPTSPGVVDIVNDHQSADVVWVCPLGGACSATNGLPVPAGTSWRFNRPATAMTVFSTAGATIRIVF